MQHQLSRVDLNLLVALQVLLEENNVTRAAERLFITQPAMSKTLQRLRTLFDDPLFTRTAHGLVPTPKAEQLKQSLNNPLKQLEEQIFAPVFDPATATGDIYIDAPEMLTMGLIPYLLSNLREKAPQVQLHTRNILDDHLDLLADGTLDFSIYIEQQYSNEFEVTILAEASPICWMRVDHPLSQVDSVRLEDFYAFPHIVLHFPNLDQDAMSESLSRARSAGLERKILFETSQLLTALEILNSTDGIMIGPPYLGDFQLTKGHIASKPLNQDMLFNRMKLHICLIQHQRTVNSPLHRWVKEQILSIYERYDLG